VVLVPSASTFAAPVTITSGDDTDPGEFPFTFTALDVSKRTMEQPFATVTYVVSATGCRVSTRRELMITDLSVVDDPLRTRFANPQQAGNGAFTFKRLMEEMASSPAAAPRMVEAFLETFTTPQTINGFVVGPRLDFRSMVLDAWPRKNGELDLEAAPLRLLAIVNRIDSRNPAARHAGEGRFVFGFVDPFGFPREATMIIEYHLPAENDQEVQGWADGWHALGAHPFGEGYSAALQALTERFTRRGAGHGASALAQLRTNEIAFGGGQPWQLREFTLDAAGNLVPSPIKLTPDRTTFDGSLTLADFVNTNAPAILLERHEVPLLFKGVPFLGGAVFNDLSGWQGTGILDPEARQKLSINTCNGCHSAAETNTFFLQISGRFPGQEAPLSPFLTGTDVIDRFTGRVRSFNDLRRRNVDLRTLVCPP
jgi:hypothetical protein